MFWMCTRGRPHFSSITRFSHTFTSAMQQRQCQGSSLSTQYLSFASGKLILQKLIDTSQISNLPCGFAQCTRCRIRLVRLLCNLSIMLVTVVLPRRTMKGPLLLSIHALLLQLATFPRIRGVRLTCECGGQSANKRCKSVLTGPKNGGREV
jgi:hypothetical protein